MSPHFSLSELTFSETASRLGIPNDPDELVLANLKKLAVGLLEPIREHVGKPIIVTSGYRSPQVNISVGGSVKSDHMVGLAADIRAVGITPIDLAQEIASIADRLPLRQLILEYGRWVHVSYGMQKKRHLIATLQDGKTIYTPTEAFA